MQPFDVLTEPNAYKIALDELRALPGVANIGLGPDYNCHSLDQMFPLAWPPQIDEDHYKYQHVEFLLDQAADLLDRGIRDRAQWEDLYEKWLRNALEVYELLAIDEVQKREEAAGIFEVPYLLSAGEESANTKANAELTAAGSKILKISDILLSPQEQDLLLSYKALLSIIGTIVTGHHGDVVGKYFPQDVEAQIQSKVAVSTKEIASREIAIEKTSFEAQRNIVNSSFVAGEAKAAGLKAKAEFDEENRTFQSERRAIGRKVAAAKQLASAINEGALNFESRMKPIQTRYENDFREALARIQAAECGLRLLYGYKQELPKPKSEAGEQFFGECLIWVRKAISFLVRFQRLDQSYVLPLSLKHLCGANWANGLAAGVLKFELRAADFPSRWSQRHLRLRGFSVFVLGEAAKGTWQLIVTAPESSYCDHLDGVRHELDQVRAAPCLAGRAGGRDAARQPDVLGTIEFFNLSPFGNWEVQVPPTSLEDIVTGKIDDIHLDLHLIARVLP